MKNLLKWFYHLTFLKWSRVSLWSSLRVCSERMTLHSWKHIAETFKNFNVFEEECTMILHALSVWVEHLNMTYCVNIQFVRDVFKSLSIDIIQTHACSRFIHAFCADWSFLRSSWRLNLSWQMWEFYLLMKMRCMKYFLWEFSSYWTTELNCHTSFRRTLTGRLT